MVNLKIRVQPKAHASYANVSFNEYWREKKQTAAIDSVESSAEFTNSFRKLSVLKILEYEGRVVAEGIPGAVGE